MGQYLTGQASELTVERVSGPPKASVIDFVGVLLFGQKVTKTYYRARTTRRACLLADALGLGLTPRRRNQDSSTSYPLMHPGHPDHPFQREQDLPQRRAEWEEYLTRLATHNFSSIFDQQEEEESDDEEVQVVGVLIDLTRDSDVIDLSEIPDSDDEEEEEQPVWFFPVSFFNIYDGNKDLDGKDPNRAAAA